MRAPTGIELDDAIREAAMTGIDDALSGEPLRKPDAVVAAVFRGPVVPRDQRQCQIVVNAYRAGYEGR